MGFSTSGATAILLVGVLVAVSVAYPVLQSAQDLRRDAIENRDNRALEVQNAAIELDAVEHADGELTVTASNDGASSLSAADTTVLVDGEIPADRDVEVDGVPGRELWLPEETLTVTVADADLPDGDPERVKLVTEYGVAITETI